MAEKLVDGRIVHKHDTEANWNKATNFIPKKGETIVYDPDSNYSYARVKVGDGTTKVTSLPFIDNAIKTAQTNLSDTVDSVKNNSITGLSVSGQTITYTKGNGTTGTITTQDNNTTYSAGTGLSLSGTTFNHKNSITAATAQGDASKTLAFGDTFTIPTITYDAQGHITGKGTTTMTMPAGPVAKEGNPVSEWGIKGTGISVETTFSPIQSGSGDPYPDGGSKNLFDYKNYTSKGSNIKTELNGDTLRVYTTADGTYTGLKYGTFTARAGTTYTGSLLINTFTSGVLTYGLRNASTNTFVVNKKVTSAGIVNFTYTATEDIEVYPSILVTNDSILSGDVTFSNVQLEVGSTATEYAPYSNIRPISGFNSAKLTRCGKNLLKNTATTQTVNGITFTVNSDGTVKANGTATANAIFTFVSSTSDPGFRNALLGKQITLSGCPSGGSSKTYDLRIYQYADANSYLMDYGSGKTATFTNAELPFNVAILIRSGVKVNNLVFRPQIEIGSTLTPYEPYQGDTFTADFGQTVYGGTLDWQTGALTSEWAMVTLTGNETCDAYGSSDAFLLRILTDAVTTGSTEIPQIVCSHYATRMRSDISNGTNVGVSIGTVNTHLIVYPGSDYTADTFKSYLAAQNTAGTPVQVCYKLATPTTIQLSPQDLKMLDSVNTIYSDGNSNYVIFNNSNSNLGKASELFLNKTSILPISNGGTGKTTAEDACNLFLNSLSTGSAKPEDTDYYICQYAGGGTSTTTYHRRPTSALYNYIKAKTDTLYPTKTGSGASGSWSISITGNAATAIALTTSAGSATLPIYFSNGKPVVCTASSVFSSLSWTGGTTSGPVLSITIAGQNRTATIPSASSTASGIITTSSQTIIGEKTFATTPVIKSSNSWSGLCFFNKNLSNYGIGIFQLTTLDNSNYVKENRLVFRTYSYASNSTTRSEYYEDFKLPSANAARTSNISYNILTTKNTIAISEGGTGATDAATARSNLSVPSTTGSGASGSWRISITGSSASCTGNAATATKLATARKLTIGSTEKTFDGSGNVSWSLSEIGAAASGHTHSYLPLSGGTLSGALTIKNSEQYPRMDFKSTSYSNDQGRIYYAIRPNMTESFFFFRNYSRSSTNYEPIDHYEDYKLPSATSNRTSNGEYLILTTKSTVTVAQGGTGSTTAAGARTNLGIIASTTAPSNPTDGMIWLEIVS